jgi:2-C-methyl-D-erythritol 4-phosphate cytidylyltransferase
MATGHPAHDSLKQVDERNRIIASPNRNQHWQVQTPQVVAYPALQAALKAWQTLPDAHKPHLTDDVQLLAWALAQGALTDTLTHNKADASQATCSVWANAAYNPKLTVHHDWAYAPPLVGKPTC